MGILAIDPGTHCGWAYASGKAVVSGVWELKGSRFEGGGMRYVRMRRFLEEFGQSIDQVAFEEVRGHKGTDAAHIYGGIVAMLTAWCEERSIPYEGIPVGTVKKRATGKGNADKPAVLAAARARWPEQALGDKDYDRADALWVLDCALAAEGAGAK